MAGGRRTARGDNGPTGGGCSPFILLGVLCLVVLADVVCSVLLYIGHDSWCAHGECPHDPEQFFAPLQHIDFEEDVVDLVVLAAGRLCLIAISLLFAWSLAPPMMGDDPTKLEAGPTFSNTPEVKPLKSINDIYEDDEDEPLLRSEPRLGDGTDPAVGSGPGVLTRDQIEVRANGLIVFFFAAMTAMQATVGIKCVMFHFGSSNLMPVLMGLTVGWINCELFMTKILVDRITREEGHHFPDLHQHPLFHVKKLPLHSCDSCGEKIKGEAYRCKSCDFDCCMKCFEKKQRSPKSETAVRGDKGIKVAKDISNSSYALRGFKLCMPHIQYLLIALVCLMCNTAASLLLPKYQGKITDMIIAHDMRGFRADLMIFIYLSIASGAFGAVRQFMFRIVGAKLSNSVRNQLFAKVVAADVAYFDGARTGDLVSRLSGDVGALVMPFRTMIGTLLSATFQLGGGIFMCFHTSWRLSMLAFVTIAPVMYLTDQYARWSRKLNYEFFSALGDASAKASEALGNIRTVKAFSTEKEELAAYTECTGNALKKAMIDALGSAATFSFTNYLDLGGTVLILWYGGTLAMDKRITVGTLVAFRLYWSMINSSYKSLMTVLSSFTRAGGAAQRVLSLMDACPDIDPDAGERLNEIKGDITLDKVEFYYQLRPEQQVLKGVDLEVKAGQVCALVGRSGGGKSTLVHLMMRFYDPTAGRVLVDGHDLAELNLRSVHDQCGLVAQDTQLFGSSIRDNISYGLDSKFADGSLTDADLIEAAKAANAHDFIVKFEDGYDTRGQKQRIALARVFLRQPKLLFLDEATSALDAESEGAVQDALDRLIAGRQATVILVAHRLSTVVNADKIAVIDGGVIAEIGTHAELLARGGIYHKLVSKQLARQANELDGDALNISVDELLATDSGGV